MARTQHKTLISFTIQVARYDFCPHKIFSELQVNIN